MSPTRGDKQTFKNEDLVLKVTTNIDPAVWDESRYEPFIDELCGMREYQKDAIRATLRYLAGGCYANLRALAEENFGSNDEMAARYGSWKGMENHHAILQHVKSSIRDSLLGKGARVAVLNDEAHHVANETGQTTRKWKEFLLNPEYDFRYVLGVSGTCYVGNDYFADVIYRYSLRQAIEQRFVKTVEYVHEMPQTDDPDEKWQLIHNRHQAWKKDLKKRTIRPLTIVVTHNIATCKRVAEELEAFLAEHEGITPEQATAKVLPVTSSAEHQPNVAKLKVVDSPTSKVEWIVSEYTKRYTRERCMKIIQASAKRAGSKGGLTEENRQKILQALGPLRRKAAKRVVYRLTPHTLRSLSTRERSVMSCSAADLRRGDKTVFAPPGCEATLVDEQGEFFREIADPDGEFVRGYVPVANSHDYKTPFNFTIADATPEKRFIRELCRRENAIVLDAWIKNAAQRFYAIEYAWKKGEHPKRGEFSPDFFIKRGNTIHVIEIKDDSEIGDPSEENPKKYEYAQTHFEQLNKWLEDADSSVRYSHNWLTPKSFNRFFQLLREDKAESFRSDLDVVLAQEVGMKG